MAFAESVARGLTDSPPWLNCTYLYDAEGSRLFEDITEQPEYYLTRAENEILQKHADEIRSITGPVSLIELGSGYSIKTAHLLAAYTRDGQKVDYVPVDVSQSALDGAQESISKHHPYVTVSGITGTYENAFPLFRAHSPSLVMFLGSTIGNFNPHEADIFWNEIKSALEPGDFFLLGVDLVKDKGLLEAAYNDGAGITAAFTKNLFARINRELGASVDLTRIQHVASYNADWQRIETFVRFLIDQEVYIEPIDQTVTVPAGTMVMIEISRKFSLDQVSNNMAFYGLDVLRTYTDSTDAFCVLLLRRAER